MECNETTWKVFFSSNPQQIQLFEHSLELIGFIGCQCWSTACMYISSGLESIIISDRKTVNKMHTSISMK